jgi:NitT/TauT family transport system substrate-binding protein
MPLSRRTLLAAGSGLAVANVFNTPVSAQALTQVQLGDVSKTCASWVLELAETQGFFAKEKLAVTTTYVGNNPAVAQQVVGGSFDLGITTMETAIRGVEKGADITTIGSGMLKFPYSFMADPSITKPADLKGKKIILDLPTGFLGFNFKKWCKANGLNPADVDTVYDGSSTNRYAALVGGVVVLAPVTQPLDFMAAAKGYKRFIDVSQASKNFAFTALVGRNDWLAKNGSTAKAFMRAIAGAANFFYDPKNHDVAVSTLQGLAKVDATIADQVYGYYTKQLQPYDRKMGMPDSYVKAVTEYLAVADLPTVGPVAKYVNHSFGG